MVSHSALRLLPPLILSTIFNHVVADSLFGGFSPLESPVARVLEHTPAHQSPAECTKLRLTGPIETTLCDYETLESVNDDLFSRLHELVETPFFKYFKVDLYRDCPFWQENGLCMQRECGVTSLDESEVPENWRAAALSRIQTPDTGVVRLPGCHYNESDYCFLDDEDEGEYIDLSQNPEKFTGYTGPSAHGVWSAIYNENCFGVTEDTATARYDQSPHTTIGLESGVPREECLEKRVYYRIISGLHASISTHICHEDLDKRTGIWGPNLDCFANRIASHPERLQNIYFNTVILLRAVSRVGPYLSAYNIDRDDNPKTQQLLNEVLSIAKVAGAFDERSLFRGLDAKMLKEEFKDRFRNVSRIMDCVGCDKCKLWGKVQVTGLAAAMKILFELDDNALNPQLNQNFLSRWEVVALINVLHRMSESLHATEDFRQMWNARKQKEYERSIAAGHMNAASPKNRATAASSNAQAAKTKSSLDTSKATPEPESSPKVIPAPSTPSNLSAPPTLSSSNPQRSQSTYSSRHDQPVLEEIQALGKTVLDVCRRGTVGCLNIISAVVHGVFHVVRMLMGDQDGGEGRSSGEL